MHDLLEVLPELHEEERTIVLTRMFNASRPTRLMLRNQFDSRELRDESVRTYESVQGARYFFGRLTKFLATKGAAA